MCGNKKTIYHRLGCNYNDIDVEITWRCQVGKHQYYSVSIVCDDSFKIMIDFSSKVDYTWWYCM